MPKPLKKVYLNDSAESFCDSMTFGEQEKPNFLKSLHFATMFLPIFLSKSTPELTDGQVKFFQNIYSNDYDLADDMNEEIERFNLLIMAHAMNTTIQDIDDFFIQSAKKWTTSEKLTVIIRARSYWRQGSIYENQ